jgi:multiple sugar transport system permease protein
MAISTRDTSERAYSVGMASDVARLARRSTLSEKVFCSLALVILVTWTVISLFPLYWMVVTSIKPSVAIMVTPPEFIPSKITLHNFATVFSSGVLRWTVNSFVVAGTVTFGQLLFASMAGYAFAKKQFAGRDLIFWIYISSMMIPTYAIVVPLYRMMAGAHLLDTYIALILPGLAAPFGTFLMRQFIQTLPSELIDAARIDGCGEWGVYRHVILPLSLPGLAVLGIFVFNGQWAEFFWPMVVTGSANMRVLTVGLASLQLFDISSGMKDYGVMMAGATWAAIPMVIIFFLFQRYFLEGITLGALKG